jgi:hypothetical protein
MVDAAPRSVVFWDAPARQGYREHLAQVAPPEGTIAKSPRVDGLAGDRNIADAHSDHFLIHIKSPRRLSPGDCRLSSRRIAFA